jgi:hypothetical protein
MKEASFVHAKTHLSELVDAAGAPLVTLDAQVLERAGSVCTVEEPDE